MTEVPSFQIVLEIAASDEVEPDVLEAATQAVFEAVQRNAAFVALGPVVSCDFSRGEIEIGCHISAETPEDLHAKVARISQVMLDAANSFEYEGSTTKKLEPALA